MRGLRSQPEGEHGRGGIAMTSDHRALPPSDYTTSVADVRAATTKPGGSCPWGSRDPSQRGHLTIENRETKKNDRSTDKANKLYEHEREDGTDHPFTCTKET